MKIKIHRGAHEIGGSCVELQSGDTRIVVDLGLPLVEKGGARFNGGKLQLQTGVELVNSGVLPDIRGLYAWDTECRRIDALFLSHAHMDHYGLVNFVSPDVPVFSGEAARRLMDIAMMFCPYEGAGGKQFTFANRVPVQVGEFRITPFLVDHSAFDAYAFLIEAQGKSVFYSGDCFVIPGLVAELGFFGKLSFLDGSGFRNKETYHAIRDDAGSRNHLLGLMYKLGLPFHRICKTLFHLLNGFLTLVLHLLDGLGRLAVDHFRRLNDGLSDLAYFFRFRRMLFNKRFQETLAVRHFIDDRQFSRQFANFFRKDGVPKGSWLVGKFQHFLRLVEGISRGDVELLRQRNSPLGIVVWSIKKSILRVRIPFYFAQNLHLFQGKLGNVLESLIFSRYSKMILITPTLVVC